MSISAVLRAGWRPRYLVFALAALVAVAAACRSSTEPTAGAPTLTPLTGVHDEQPGTPLPEPVSVRVTGPAGQPMAGITVTWTVTAGGGSVSPPSSVTDGNGVAQTIWTLGPTPGEQRLTAAVGAVSVVFTAEALSVDGCAATLALPVGGICLASPAIAASINVQGTATGAEFVAIPFHHANFARTAISVSATATGATAAAGPPTPSVSPLTSITLGPSTAQLLPDVALERRLRERARAELRPLVADARARRADALAGRLGPGYSVTPAAPRLQVGSTLTLNANPHQSCTNPVNKQAVIRAQSTNAFLVEDTENPPNGFTDADRADILARFEAHAWPTVIQAFGQPTDIDGNQKVLIFYTVEVNKMTAPGAGTFIGGFFHSRDLFPRTQQTSQSGKLLTACPASNVAEMFYMLAPDPNTPFNREFVTRTTVGTIAHEMQHLINSARRLYVNAGAAWPETVWVEEGLSHIAEELTYYRATGRAPRQNIDSLALRESQQQLDFANMYIVSNLSRLRSYLRTPNTQSPYGETPQAPGAQAPPDHDDIETRGAIWSFMRWAADQRAGGDGDTWFRLVNNAQVGPDNLRTVFGANLGARFREWAAANYTSDAVPTGSTAFEHLSWNYRSVVPLLEDPEPPRRYQLTTMQLTDQSPASFSLVDGGAAYLRFGVPAGATATIRVTSGGGNLPASARVWFVRTK